MSLFNQATPHIFTAPAANHRHDYTSVIRRSREEPKTTNVTSLRILAGLRFVQEAQLFFEELQAGVSSIFIRGEDVDVLWCKLDWHRYILALWTEEFKGTSGVMDSKWMDLVERWTTLITAALTLVLKYASPSNSHQRPTPHDDTDGLSFEESLTKPIYRISVPFVEMEMVDSIVAATREKVWGTPLLHYLAFTDMIESVKDNLKRGQPSMHSKIQRGSGMEASEFECFIQVVATEIKLLLDLLPPESQDLLNAALNRALRRALSHYWPEYTVRSLKFYHTMISNWHCCYPALEIELEEIFQLRVQETFGSIIRPYECSDDEKSAPYTVKDLEDIIALGADIHGKVRDCCSGRSLWAAAGSVVSVDIFEALIHAGAPYTKGAEGSSPLHAAAGAGNLGIVIFLLGKKQHNFNVEVNGKDQYNKTALHQAAEAGNESVVNFLLKQRDIEVNCQDSNGDTPFLLAIKSSPSSDKKKYATIKTLLRDPRVKRELERQDRDVDLHLHLAADIRDATLRLIIRHVHGINSQDRSGRTPLHKAVEANSGSNVQLLLQNGADPTLIDEDGFTPLLLACNKRHLGPMKVLLRLSNAFTVQCPFPVLAESIYASGPEDQHFSPVTLVLHDISGFGKSRMEHVGFALKVILAAKPDLEVRDREGRSVLNRVINSIDGGMLRDLLRAGANVNSQDHRGRTPLHHFRGFQHHSYWYEVLFEFGADPDIRDGNGELALPVESEDRYEGKKVERVIQTLVAESRRLKQEKELKMLAEKTKAYAAKQKEKKKAERDGTLTVVNRFSALAVEETEDDEEEAGEGST